LLSAWTLEQKGLLIVSENISSTPVELAAEIVSAFVSNNAIPPAELPTLIADVHSALAKVAKGQTEKPVEALVPPVSVKRSITPDYLISLEDGRRYSTLKRHLTTRGLTPQAYREKWGLSPEYPMVAPNYAKHRSELAKALGLGQTRHGQRSPELGASQKPQNAAEAPAKRRARGKQEAAA
jgi:predicted transcriptional regulator